MVIVHLVSLLGSEPGEIGGCEAVLLGPEWLGPSECLVVGAFRYQGDGVIVEAQISVLADVGAGEDITAYEADGAVLLELFHVVIDHVGDVAQAHAADALDVSGVAYAGASDGHCLAHVYLAGVEGD